MSRAARWGDGWCPFFADPAQSKINRNTAIQSVEHLGEKITSLKELRAAHGKSGNFDIAIGPPGRPGYGSAGAAEQYLEAVDSLAESGATWMVVEPPSPSRKAYMENVQWFGEEVIARL